MLNFKKNSLKFNKNVLFAEVWGIEKVTDAGNKKKRNVTKTYHNLRISSPVSHVEKNVFV